jgi:hypothetical protein
VLRRNNPCLREERRTTRCHLASPRRRERMFHGRSSDSAGSTLLTGLPRAHRSSVIVAFVPAYRCGAVPDFHRIPFSFSSRRNLGMTTISWAATQRKPNPCGYFAKTIRLPTASTAPESPQRQPHRTTNSNTPERKAGRGLVAAGCLDLMPGSLLRFRVERQLNRVGSFVVCCH